MFAPTPSDDGNGGGEREAWRRAERARRRAAVGATHQSDWHTRLVSARAITPPNGRHRSKATVVTRSELPGWGFPTNTLRGHATGQGPFYRPLCQVLYSQWRFLQSYVYAAIDHYGVGPATSAVERESHRALSTIKADKVWRGQMRSFLIRGKSNR